MITYDIEAMGMLEARPKITVIGIGGAGGNMLNAVVSAGIEHISCIALNTDAKRYKMYK